MLENAYTTMSNYGDSGKKIWVTEYGQATGTSEIAVDEEKQAAILTDFLQKAEGVRYLGPPFLFTTRDLSEDPSISDFNYGLYRMNFTEKVVVQHLRQLTGQ